MNESTAIEIYQAQFDGVPQLLASAPGRLEILGNHTDYNEGYVLSIAVDCRTYIALSAIEGKECFIISPDVEDQVRSFHLEKIATPSKGKDWLNYIRGVVVELQGRGHKVGGFRAAIHSTVPLSAGMSSSASLEMALVKGLNELFDLKLDVNAMAKVGQGCENNYIMANTGLMDQLTSLCGKQGSLLFSEYRGITVSSIKFMEGYSFIVADTQIAHDLSEDYNERRESCQSAFEKLQKFYPETQSLRDIGPEQLQKNKEALTEIEHNRAFHVVGENTRVHQAIDYLAKNQIKEFGQLLFDSHNSSSVFFENSCPELDVLVKLAYESPLCVGARLSGGGFGGISIHLVADADRAAYRSYLEKRYFEETGKKLRTLSCVSADGANVKQLKEEVIID